MNNTNTAARLVMDKAQEAQQALLGHKNNSSIYRELNAIHNKYSGLQKQMPRLRHARLQTLIKMIEGLACKESCWPTCAEFLDSAEDKRPLLFPDEELFALLNPKLRPSKCLSFVPREFHPEPYTK
ncbi:unnamed protein product, partial [Mesorhabditis spiculigera]